MRVLRPPLEFPSDHLLILLALEAVLLFLRMNRVRGLLARGVPLEGTVDRVYRPGTGAGSRTKVEYLYTGNGAERRGGYLKRSGFEPGQKVTVVVDPVAPKKSLIREIFVW
ncbi:MAG: hypothetical protein JSV86_21085 [Gemmatimonadota bacterium]|nr:MAG: hypothetical protein JSV86_21085 [Gemmatimonadota bacterium]